MRNNFSHRKSNQSWPGGGSDAAFTAHAASPDQAAVVWNEEGEVVSAMPVPGSAAGAYDMDITRLPSDFNLAAALNIRRENHLGPVGFSDQTHFLTTVSDFSERTRILALSGEILALSDAELFEWLINAERQMILGTDNHPVFETSLEETACTFLRLPNGQVAMTEVPRQHIEATRRRMREAFGQELVTPINLTIETPLRSMARFFLTALPEGGAVLREGRESEATVFMLVGQSGFSYGLWSPSAGLFSEYAFLAPAEINARSFDPQAADPYPTIPTIDADAAPEDDAERAQRTAQLTAYIRHAFEQLFIQLAPEKLEQLQLSTYAQVVWAADPALAGIAEAVAGEYSDQTGLEFFQIGAPVDEASASGLLFGSFTFGDETVVGAEILPPVNMARDLLVLADKEEIERRQIEEMRLFRARTRAALTIWAAPVLVFAFLLASAADIVRQNIALAFRDQRADARTTELKPALDRRKSYEENLKWYQEFITQVSRLRRQQPVGIGMLFELNKNYPFSIDPAFYVSDMKLLPTGAVEIKGLARNKDAVTSFLRSLEFAGGPESGSRLFSNLTYEVQEGTPPAAVPGNRPPNAPTLTGSTLTGTGPAPGVIAWSIKGSYLPMAEFIPPDPDKNAKPNAAKPGAQPGPAPAAAPSTAPKTNS